MVDSITNHSTYLDLRGRASSSSSERIRPAGEAVRDADDRNRKIVIHIADPMAVTAELLKQALSSQPDCEISGCSKTLEELVEMTSADPPDIVLIKDTDLKGAFDAIAILETIHRVSPATKSIVLSSGLGKHDVIAYFHAQARGILPADMTDFATVCRCIHAVFEGQIWASSEHLGYLIDSLSGAKPIHLTDDKNGKALSVREREVLNLLAEGRSNRSMAEALKLSEHTIKNHLFHIFYKLGVSSRTEAVLYAMKQPSAPERRKVS